MNDDTNPLGDALHERAERLQDSPVTLDDVRARAGGIRRRRRIAAGVGALAVVAALAPVGLVVLGGDDGGPVPAATDTNGQDDAAAAEGLAYLSDGSIVRADGTSFRPQVPGTLFAFAPLGDGRWVVQTQDDQAPTGTTISVVGDEGARLAEYPAGDSTLTTADDAARSVGWIDRDGAVQVLQAGSDQPVPVGPGSRDTRLIEVRGDCADAAGCAVLEETYSAEGTRTGRLSGGASEPFLAGVFESVSDVSPDGNLVAGTVSIDELEPGSCSGVYDRDGGRLLWKSCDTSGLTFSPDGSMVLGVDPYLDGPNHAINVVLDAQDGSVLDQRGGIFYEEQWSSADTWLVVQGIEGSDQSRLVRYSVGGGAPQEVGAPVADQFSAETGYHLQAR